MAACSAETTGSDSPANAIACPHPHTLGRAANEPSLRIASTATALVLSLAVTLTACGGDDTNSTSRQQQLGQQRTPTTRGSKNGEADGQAAKPTTQYKRLTKAQLDQVLLTIDDLPPGYSADPKDESNGTAKYCGSAPPNAPTKSKAGQDFTKGGGLGSELASASVVQYSSPAEASRIFRKLSLGPGDMQGRVCRRRSVTYELKSAPKTGYPTLGFRVTGEGYAVFLNIAQVGPSLVNSGSGGVTNADADLAASLVTQQIASTRQVPSASSLGAVRA